MTKEEFIDKTENWQGKYYPQYCIDCHWPFISKKRNVPCDICGKDNVINCFRENYAMIKARYGDPKEESKK